MRLPVSGRHYASIIGYGLLFLIFFCLFCGWFIFDAWLNGQLGRLKKFAAAHNITLEIDRNDIFPPRIQAAILSEAQERPLARLEAVPALFSRSINVKGIAFGGTFTFSAKLNSLFSLKDMEFNYTASNLQARELYKLYGSSLPLIINGGVINIKGAAALTAGMERWQMLTSTTDLRLEAGSLTFEIPVLKNNVIQGISGDSVLEIKNKSLMIKNCQLHAHEKDFSLAGVIQPWYMPPNARLDINLMLKLPASAVDETLIPKRTMTQLKQRGFVASQLGGTLSRPEIRLEN